MKNFDKNQDYYCYVIMNLNKRDIFEYCGVRFTAEPLYVGLGRDLVHRRIELSERRFRGKGYNVEGVKIKMGLDRDEGMKFERLLIETIGRKCKGTGPLLNKHIGGATNNGGTWTDETRKKFSENHPMKRPEVAAKISGKNNGANTKRYRNSFVSNNPMKDFETASKVNKQRRAKADPEKVRKAVAESNRTRGTKEVTRLKLKLAGYKRYGNVDKMKEVQQEIDQLMNK